MGRTGGALMVGSAISIASYLGIVGLEMAVNLQGCPDTAEPFRSGWTAQPYAAVWGKRRYDPSSPKSGFFIYSIHTDQMLRIENDV